MIFGILDRYVLRKFMATFFFSVLIFSMIALAIDFADKVDAFLSEPVSLREIVFDYLIKFVIHINSLMWPLFALISVIFFTSRMAFNSEIISIFNAGVSYWRFLRPYLVGAGLLAGFLTLANHTIVPKANRTRINFEQTYVWKDQDKGRKENIHMYVGPNTKIYIGRFNMRDSTATKVKLEKYKDNEITYMISAKQMKWLGPPGRWRLQNYVARTIDGVNEYLDIGPRKKIDTLLNLTPRDFVQYLNAKEQMTTRELYAAIAKQKKRGLGTPKKFQIEILRRTSEPVSIIILTIIGAAVSSRKVRGGVGLHLAMGIGLGAIFIFLTKFSMTFAFNSSFPAALGVWLPNIVFAVIAVILTLFAQK